MVFRVSSSLKSEYITVQVIRSQFQVILLFFQFKVNQLINLTQFNFFRGRYSQCTGTLYSIVAGFRGNRIYPFTIGRNTLCSSFYKY